MISTLEVDGFGWLRRDGLSGLRAESADYADFAVSDLPAPWPGWLARAFTTLELDNLQAILVEERQRPMPTAHLAHGDLDVTHIWLDPHGQYTGIIDFGEARGADPFFDVGHFLLHDRETRPPPLFEELPGRPAPALDLARPATQLPAHQPTGEPPDHQSGVPPPLISAWAGEDQLAA